MPGSARPKGNERSNGERYDDNKDYRDEPTLVPPPPSLFEQRLSLKV
jgi:hypothetical protein